MYHIPEKFLERMKNMLGGEYDEFYRAMLEKTVQAAIRINTLKSGALKSVTDEFGALSRVPWCRDGYYCSRSEITGRHPYHMAGLFYFQEPSAMSAVEAADISPGDYVLDLCAAPGGKATQAAAKLGGSGLLMANEIIPKRAKILSENIERMGVKNAVVTNETPERLSKKYPSFFDKIIVDAPCSGEGMFRKEQKAAEDWSIEHTVSCAKRQQNILKDAVEMLKKGGRLVYSTCTLSPEENEQTAVWLIENCGLEPVPIPELDSLSPARNEWSGSKTDVSAGKRIFVHRQDGEGHFVMAFLKPYGEETEHKRVCGDTLPKLYREFERKTLNIELNGRLCTFGDNLYLLNEDIDVDKIKVQRYGLHLGEMKKNRFEPSHALALALKKEDFKNSIDLPCDSMELDKYLHGNTIDCDFAGYGVVCVNSYPVGWGKASGGVLKNHYPKALRLL